MGDASPEDVKDIADRLKFVSAAVIDRVDAEFEQRLQFRCFDVEAVRKAFECDDPRQARSLQLRLQRELKELAQVLRVDHVEAAFEYRSVVPLV